MLIVMSILTFLFMVYGGILVLTAVVGIGRFLKLTDIFFRPSSQGVDSGPQGPS